MLPKLLDTLSTTFQQSSTRMDGLIGQMTQELHKVLSPNNQLSVGAASSFSLRSASCLWQQPFATSQQPAW